MRAPSRPISILDGLDRSPTAQAVENLNQALRVLDMLPMSASPLTPHPVTVIRAEIENARRYLALAQTRPRLAAVA